ncbi:hypothetical protein AOL_s00079g299 [Orbilia oligospora ATCC 24927]|uniref:Uncharacterized protein n=1 Tax=Arthrobotrys oligospora (strain ATCC 24927 / CBS 115.81 / DSM 1491) TaxID=756982 RepID=G1XCX9_ARTOA|nr:hypothetical protein AOL_s00079g299 [Orbilia oligospora ATCC 24927]EGX49078.1 hypothetical protein AOL_s00079g299 [Orbilia oligospora ATCC 24927]
MAPYSLSLSLLLLTSATVTLARPFQNPDILGPIKVFPTGGDPVYKEFDKLVDPKEEPKLAPRGFDPSAIVGTVSGGLPSSKEASDADGLGNVSDLVDDTLAGLKSRGVNPLELVGTVHDAITAPLDAAPKSEEITELTGGPEVPKVTPEDLASGSAAEEESTKPLDINTLIGQFEAENLEGQLQELGNGGDIPQADDLDTNIVGTDGVPTGDTTKLRSREVLSDVKPVLKGFGANVSKDDKAPVNSQSGLQSRDPLDPTDLAGSGGLNEFGASGITDPKQITGITDGLTKLLLPKTGNRLARRGLKLQPRKPLNVPGLDSLNGLGLDKIIDPKRITKVTDEEIKPLLKKTGLPLLPKGSKFKRQPLPPIPNIKLPDEEVFEILQNHALEELDNTRQSK